MATATIDKQPPNPKMLHESQIWEGGSEQTLHVMVKDYDVHVSFFSILSHTKSLNFWCPLYQHINQQSIGQNSVVWPHAFEPMEYLE